MVVLEKRNNSKARKGGECFSFENMCIVLNGTSARKEFSVFITINIPDANMMDAGTQCFPLNDVKNNYNIHEKLHIFDENDVFKYIYGVLHSPYYREKYSTDLQKELPYIPILKNKESYIKIGEKLIDLHLNYEKQEKLESVVINKKLFYQIIRFLK